MIIETKGAALPLEKIQHLLSTTEMYFREDYLKHADKNAKFEDMVRQLGNPLDEDEVYILANAVCKIFERRMNLLESVAEWAKIFSITKDSEKGGTEVFSVGGAEDGEEIF